MKKETTGTYIDGFVLALPKKDAEAYSRWARKTGSIWREHGALEVKECVADQLTGPDATGKTGSPFQSTMKLKSGETMFFSYVVFKSRAHRDRVSAKVYADPRSIKLMDPKNMPFSAKRMAFGGFKVVVDL